MKAFLQDENGDLLVENHKLQRCSGKVKALQSWIKRMLTVESGCRLDLSRGLPYQRVLLRKGTSKNRIKKTYRDESLKVAEITRITSIIVSNPDPYTRLGDVEIEAYSGEEYLGTLRFKGQLYDPTQIKYAARGRSHSSSLADLTIV
jgi:hypothetical protein